MDMVDPLPNGCERCEAEEIGIWGKSGPSFLVAEAAAYQRDLPKAEVHFLDAGQFASYEKPDKVARLTSDFLQRTRDGSAVKGRQAPPR